MTRSNVSAIDSQLDVDADAPMEYQDFRTGLTFGEVYHLIFHRRYKRRRAVLGYWHELKQKMYQEYLEIFYHYQRYPPRRKGRMKCSSQPT